jgi:tryptophan synthase alpha chain
MAARDSIGAAIRAARTVGRPALVAYITAGFPRREGFRELLSAVANAADVVEIGVPFTDPMADGTTIQRSSRVALEQGVTLKWILSELTTLSGQRTSAGSPILLMSYLNPLLAYGLDRLPADAANAGVSGFIVPDLPYEECAELHAALDVHGLALVQFVTPVTPVERMKMLSESSSGFLYAVTMTGTTGKNVAVPTEVLEYFARVKEISPVPVCAGFGIRSREQVDRLAPYVDGVIVGSALVEVIERGEDPATFLRSLRTERA